MRVPFTYQQAGPPRTFLRADSVPLTPGEIYRAGHLGEVFDLAQARRADTGKQPFLCQRIGDLRRGAPERDSSSRARFASRVAPHSKARVWARRRASRAS